MTFTIAAELPLGTYRGNGRDRQPEPMPSVARLHAALLCAAGFGPRAVPDGQALAPCDADAAALRWLEDHPPDGVRIPALTVNRARTVAYRDDGTVHKSKTVVTIKKLAKSDATVAVNGQFVWIWHEDPPPVVQAALAALCGDVPYLGTSESPARLCAGLQMLDATHHLDRDAGMFTSGGGHDVEAPRPGRTAELTAAHRRATATAPRPKQDAVGSDEKSLSAVPLVTAVQRLRYADRAQPSLDVPWSQVIMLQLDRAVEQRYRVGWAVAAHRALIGILGEGAPPLITGVYTPGEPRPANRLALHLLDASMPCVQPVDAAGCVLAMLVPAGADAVDVAALDEAVAGMTSFRGPGGRLARVLSAPKVIPGARFWADPAAGALRLWRTVPAAVPDTRGVRGQQWTFAHAALLSLGFVWKDLLPSVSGRREDYYRNLAGAVSDRGVAVVHTRAVRSTDVELYCHRVHEHAVVRPYTACLWLGDLAAPWTVAALGQSRHLGGGLLVPFDVPDGVPADQVHLPQTTPGGQQW